MTLVARIRGLSALGLAMLVYTGLGGIELVRALLFERPASIDSGFHGVETAVAAEGARTFQWTLGASGRMQRPRWGEAVRVPLFMARPQMPTGGVTVELAVDGRTFHRQRIDANGWYPIDVYLPAIGDGKGSSTTFVPTDADTVALSPVRGEVPFGRPVPVARPQPDYLRTLTGWRPRPTPAPVSLTVSVDSTFRPSALGGSDDRDLGVGVGELLWAGELPADGIGFYGWEGQEGRPFRWSRGLASMPVDVPRLEGSTAPINGRLYVRAADPGVDTDPLPVRVLWDAEVLAEVTLANTAWHEIVVSAVAGGRAVVTVSVGRTWSPARAGVAPDGRELGVAVTRVEWDSQP